MRFSKRIKTALLAVCIAVLTGCGAAQNTTAQTTLPQEAPLYTVPPFLDSEFHADQAQKNGDVQIDVSAVSQGYIAVSAESEKRLKVQVLCGEQKYNYDLHNDGTPEVFPLQCEDGMYTVRVMENMQGNQYAEKASVKQQVTLQDEFQPFLRPNQYVNYRESSDCVQKVRELAGECHTDTDLVRAVYGYLCDTVKYDHDKAENVEKGYLPSPDETLHTGKGICFDYAALSAAMLRSMGVPTKLVTGYVGDLYHAWNIIYLKEHGWITMEIKASAEQWQRIDVTFAASGTDAAFLTDDGNYIVRYIY